MCLKDTQANKHSYEYLKALQYMYKLIFKKKYYLVLLVADAHGQDYYVIY